MAQPQDVPIATIDAARRGNTAAADRLVAETWPHAYRIAYSLLRDRELAQDAAQEACAMVFAKIAGLRSADAFRVWLYRIILRVAARLERKQKLSRALGFARPVDDDIARSTLRADLHSALGKLTRRERAAVVLRYYADMNSREIASVLGIPDGSVRFHLAAARRRLEELLEEQRADQRFLEVARAT
jgi:RNA polymerase sigma-70 factor (ECF subfamily)